MLEGLIAWVLNNYLGKYVSNLNTDQLSVALLKGAVELENLPLKKDALKELLPFEVKAGFIGKVTLQIPFYRPHVDPWVISVSKLHLVGSPAKPEDFDEEREKLLERENKKAVLLALEEKWKKEQEQVAKSYWYSVTASVVARIVENIELNIQDVHLRFEDGITNPSQPSAFGVCIKNVSVQNAANEPVEELMKKKQLEIADFSIYWDTDCALLGDLPPGELQRAMDESMESRDHNYIMEPVCTSALLKRNCSKEPLRSRNTPRLEFDIQMEMIPLKLSQTQYRQIMDFLKELDRKERQLKFRRWKPRVPVTGNCRAWWHFALDAYIAEIREQKGRSCWEFALRRARDAVAYTDLYSKTLKEEELCDEEQEEMDRIEDEQTFEELKILRQIVYHRFCELAESIKEPLPDPLETISEAEPAASTSGRRGMIQYLQSWFPGWGGWYGDLQEAADTFEGLLSETSEQWRPEDPPGADEFFDPTADVSSINTFTKRDHVLAKLNLRLQGGLVTLLHAEKRGGQAAERAFMQLEFSGVTILAEALPRRNSSLFKVQLGSLFLRDLATEGTIFPLLVFPNLEKEVGCASSVGLQTSSSEASNQSSDPAIPVFEMLYERNPVRSNFERRLEVSTQPLNIIYNPQAIKKVADFFYKGKVHTSGFGCQSELELRVAEAARRQYNKLKMQTKAEIRQTIDRLLVGDFIEDSKRWTVCLDISAPQVIFPDDFKYADPVLVVIDLGRMLLTSSQEEHKKKSSGGPSSELSDVSDDEYRTPLATPPSSPPPEARGTRENKGLGFTGVEISEEQLQAHLMSKKMYDTYSLSFMDLQIMVGRVKDNWKYAQDVDVGPTHVVEKFNVHLQLERRLIYTSDPKYPGAVLSGHLPDLKIHINEDKIMALNNCFARLSASDADAGRASRTGKEPSAAGLDSHGSLHSSVVNLTQSVVTMEQHTKEVLVESQLLLAEFQVNCMQLGVESHGRYISVLKVFGTNAHFVKRPYDAEVSLTVHGLLLVDTMQTYGADFDLLMASHKNLGFDLPTGSLRDSSARSPVGGPNETRPTEGLRSAEKSVGPPGEFPGGSGPNDESLIKLEYQFVSAECPSMNLDNSLQVISVQMNNLDIILNPETIVELIGFLQKSFPKAKEDASPLPLTTDAERCLGHQDTFQSTYAQSTEVAVDIRWLNVLLLRTVTAVSGEKRGRKIATASVGGTKVNVSMGSRLEVRGSLGCLHLLDLTQDNPKSQYVVSIGNTVRYENLLGHVGCSKPVLLQFEDGSHLPDALSFAFAEQSKDECSLQLKMASLHYNHSARFLKEITLSMDELEESFRGMLKSAATKVTTVLATKTAEYTEMVSLFDPVPRSRDGEEEEAEGDEFVPSRPKTEPIKLILNVNIESPVVSIPRKPGSPELLVGHLGQISIQNFVAGEDSRRHDRLQVEIRDIRMYSLNTSHLVGKKEADSEGSHRGRPPPGQGSTSSQEDVQFTRHDFFESLHKGHAFHILNNATIQFELEKIPVENSSELAFCMNEDIEISSLMRIEGKFVNPLQVVLAKHVYEQVVQTLDNLVCNEDLTSPPPSFPSSAYPSSSPPSASLGSGGTDFPFDRKDNGLFGHSGSGPAAGQFAPVKEAAHPFTQVQATFHISELQVQLSGDLTLGAQGLVSLKFQDFDIEFAKDHPQTLSVQIALRSLLMEDLLEKNPDSQYKKLMVSRGAPKPSTLAHKEYLSQSCPSVSHVEYPEMPRSLPSHMEEAPNVFQFYQRPAGLSSHRKRQEDQGSEYPSTPPPSPTAEKAGAKSDFDDALVHVHVLLVDKKHPEFDSRYGKLGRSVDVDFNCLDVLITLQTWVVILDFFGIGSTAENHSLTLPPEDVPQAAESDPSLLLTAEVQDSVSTKVDLKVHSLSLVLNKATSELAKANVSKLVMHVEMMEGDLALQGSIGSLSLSDLTSHGELYRERFVTSGEEALIFQVYKYGRPDPLLQRDCDIRVSLRMSSVQYVHTQRFQAEVVSFIQHFTQLQDVLGRQRAAVEGQMVRDQAQRAARVLLDIEAGAPVLLIPESSRSVRLIVANLGKLKVKNRFLFAGTVGTFSLKDKDSILQGKAFKDPFSSEQDSAQPSSPSGTPKHGVRRTPSDESKGTPASEGLVMNLSSPAPLLPQQKSELATPAGTKPPKVPDLVTPEHAEEQSSLLDCIVVDLQDMDIFAAERTSRDNAQTEEDAGGELIFPSFRVRQTGGSLLTEPFRLKLQVERNLDKEMSHQVPDISVRAIVSSVHCSLDLSKYQLIRGLLENNLGEPIEEFMRPYDLQDPRIHTVLSGEVYTTMSLLIDMVNVSLELTNPRGKPGSLARFDFKKSKLLFESFSNQTRSINLVSHSMMAFDTRYAGPRASGGMPNVFNCIFQPSKNSCSQGAIQIELHYRSTKDSSFFTVVLNNLRVFLIFDWLAQVHAFLQTPSDTKKQPPSGTPSRQRSSGSETSVVPKAVKCGIVTKRSSLQISAEKQLEVKINVTDTEFVVVEDMSCLDTNAIILKGTTVLTYKPKLVDHPFSGSLSGIEVFSCRLGNEQETALSIIDPALIQVELVGSSSYPSGSGLLDAFNSEDFPPVLEIQLQALDIRLSYNDVQLFLAIAKSIPGQTSSAGPDPSRSEAGIPASSASSGSPRASEVSGLSSETSDTPKHTLDPILEVQLARLQELGFSLEDCRKALLECQGQLKKAASWLFKNAEPQKCTLSDSSDPDNQGGFALRWISGLDIKAESICICFIDDCMDCDVPLAELTFSRLNFLQHLRTSPEGYAHFTLSGDYYNRELSGWEPFIEPWPCSVSWQQQLASRLHPPRLKLEVKAKHRLDINITSVLIEQYTRTKQSWMADYCKQEKEAEEVESEEWIGSSVDPPSLGQAEMKAPKRRQPFVPFALRNHTGCTLWFSTLTTTPTRAALSHSGSPGVIPEEKGTFFEGTHKVSEWREVLTGEEIPFAFEAKTKLRHRHTHDLRIHQLQVRVNGWEAVSPVSVDKVGIFFRYAAPDKTTSSSTVSHWQPVSRTNIIHPHVYFSSLPPVRVVFAVTMEGSARKVVTVRSALIVKNKLDLPMELRLDSPSAPDKPVVLPSVMPGDSFAIPLHLTSWRLQARPKGMGVFFCKSPIHWTNVQKTSEVSSSKRECHAMESENSRFFRFCVAIKKENYPDYMPSSIFSDSAKQIFRQPGHTIYLLPTVVLGNLLPCELEFYVKGMPISGTLKPGKEAVLHTADTSQNIELGVSLENFPRCKELLIPPGTQNYIVRMRLYDVNKRLLNLTIRIVCRAEGSLKIFISAPYWLINKTGLPLIFRQDNAKVDAAGQFEEHEVARSLSPLLFCYADKEQPNLCTMRVGRGIHPDGMPGWCQGFSLDGGSGVRALKVIQQGNRPGLIYNIGIDVRKGRGRYIDSCIVTFAPRYLLDNKSKHKLAFAQRAFARGQGTCNPDGYISTLPGSSVVFHWPRNDYDQLLCVRLMDVPNCIWSGGFEVNKNNSFHINMRDTQGKCYFLRVEITLKGATYRVSFSDTDQLPPPFRIDNFSKVPIVFTQHGVAEPRLSTEVKPSTSLDYAWDEPSLPPCITLTVKGAGSSEITCYMDDFQDSKQLYYENFIYIAATYTFSGLQAESGRPVTSSKGVDCAELVLDVSLKTQRVILKKKEPGKRSQLWRMTGTGMLCHEGSAVPHHPNKPSPPRSAESSLILDIAGLAAVTDNRYEPLMLRKPDRRRSTTQTWSFRDGKLACGIHGLVVQVKGGRAGLHDGAEVVLGPDTSLEKLGAVAPEQQFINQKMRPGSGVLVVRVIPDGPTRVLQITDFSQRRNDCFSYEADEMEQDLRRLRSPETKQELEVQLKLEGGLGLSLVNKVPEELVFASFTGIHVHFTQLSTSQVLELSIQDMQVDNQLLRTTQPFMLFLTPKTGENEAAETGPAVQLNAMKFPSKSSLTDIYKHLMVTASKFTVQIEEKLFLKLLSFFGYDRAESEVESYDENLHENPADQGGAQKRYYFENLKISLPQIKLSVLTSSKLPLDLKALKSTLGFPLVRFEDAVINLDPFTRVHPYETKEFIINDILKHFQEELLSQAARILSSVDFLGNPMGLLNDVSEGVTGLIKYGNVGGLIRNVAHGVSNSAAKFTGTLSDGLGKTMDNRHQTEREYIRYHAATSGEHLVAGIQGLAHGIIGGLTSVITSTVEGVKTEGGVSGFISGLGKGLVGTVTKPVAGALDFASETAQAVRETATLTGPRTQAERVRRPRCCMGPQGLLPRYSDSQAEGQELLFRMTEDIQDEFFIAVENIDSYCVIISSKAVYFLKGGSHMDRESIFLEVKYDDLYHCLISKDHGKVYVQLTKKAVNSSSGVAMPGPSHQKPMVHVTSEELAVKLSQEINYAKSLFYEQQLMLRSSEQQEQLELDS